MRSSSNTKWRLTCEQMQAGDADDGDDGDEVRRGCIDVRVCVLVLGVVFVCVCVSYRGKGVSGRVVVEAKLLHWTGRHLLLVRGLPTSDTNLMRMVTFCRVWD